MQDARFYRVSRWAIEHEWLVWLIFTFSLVAGAIGYFQLPVRRFPSVELPAVAVSISVPQRAPDELETAIAIPLERAARQLKGVRKTWTQISAGHVVTIVQFDSRYTEQPLTRQVALAVRAVGASEQWQPQFRRLQIDSAPVLAYAVTSTTLPLPLLSAYVDVIVLPKLRGQPGVATAERLGGSDQHLEIALDPSRMRAVGVTPSAVVSVLEKSRNRPVSPADLRRLDVLTTTGGSANLSDIASVTQVADPTGHVMLDKEHAVGFQITKRFDSDSLAIDDAVQPGSLSSRKSISLEVTRLVGRYTPVPAILKAVLANSAPSTTSQELSCMAKRLSSD